MSLAQELQEERFGGPISLTTTCYRCGELITKNIAGFYVHVEPHDCQVPTLLIVEAR